MKRWVSGLLIPLLSTVTNTKSPLSKTFAIDGRSTESRCQLIETLALQAWAGR